MYTKNYTNNNNNNNNKLLLLVQQFLALEKVLSFFFWSKGQLFVGMSLLATVECGAHYTFGMGLHAGANTGHKKVIESFE